MNTLSFVDTKIISITSQSATIKRNGTFLSNLRYELGAIIKDEPDIVHRQVQLLNAQIPVSFYVINYTNNLFKYKFGSGSILTKTIPTGNYTATSLITAIKTAVNDANFNMTINTINGVLTFTYNTSFIIYNNFTYSIGYVLGFNNATYTDTAFSIVAPFPLNLLGIKNLQIRCSNISMNNISSVQGGATTLLATIPVSATPFGMIDYTDKSNSLIAMYNTNLDDLDIDVVDGETGQYINFNNVDWCITLAFHLHRIVNPSLVKTSFTSLATSSNPQKQENKNLNDLELLTS